MMEAAAKNEQSRFLDSKLDFKHLPAFAKYLLENKLVEFIEEQLKLAREVDLPLLKLFANIPEAQLIEISKESNTEFLNQMIDNNLDWQIADSLQKWRDNQLPLITGDQLIAEDLTFTSYMRKQAFAHFIPQYTSDVAVALNILHELDKYYVKSETLSFKLFISLQHDKLDHLNLELQLNQEELLHAQELANIGSFEWDLANHKSTLSPQLSKILEMDQSSNWAEFIEYVHAADRDKVKTAIDNALAGEEKYEAEYRYKRNGDEKVIMSRGIVTFEDGKPQKMTGTCQDVTQDFHLRLSLKQKNEQLRISEERYQRMIAEVQDYAIILMDKDGIIQNWNFGAEKIKGYKAEEIVGKSFSTFYTEKDKDEKLPYLLLAQAARMGRATHEGFRVRKDGTTFWGSIVLTALHDNEGNIIGYSKVTRDLTERKISEDRLLKYTNMLEENEQKLKELNHSLEYKNQELERSNKELNSFNYVASHDLQEPLRKIKTFTSMIADLEGDHMSEKGKQLFTKIHTASGRMQQLIEDLLAFSRTNITIEEFESVDLNTIAAETKSQYEELITAGELTFEIDHLPKVTGLSFQLQQLFTNIVGNSMKYRKPDTAPHITIRYNKVAGATIENNGIDPNKEYHHIIFSDNGIGFDQRYAEKVFEIFQRLHHGSTYKGTGIGLAICKKIVQNHQGIIVAEGKECVGASFHIYLPTQMS